MTGRLRKTNVPILSPATGSGPRAGWRRSQSLVQRILTVVLTTATAPSRCRWRELAAALRRPAPAGGLSNTSVRPGRTTGAEHRRVEQQATSRQGARRFDHHPSRPATERICAGQLGSRGGYQKKLQDQLPPARLNRAPRLTARRPPWNTSPTTCSVSRRRLAGPGSPRPAEEAMPHRFGPPALRPSNGSSVTVDWSRRVFVAVVPPLSRGQRSAAALSIHHGLHDGECGPVPPRFVSREQLEGAIPHLQQRCPARDRGPMAYSGAGSKVISSSASLPSMCPAPRFRSGSAIWPAASRIGTGHRAATIVDAQAAVLPAERRALPPLRPRRRPTSPVWSFGCVGRAKASRSSTFAFRLSMHSIMVPMVRARACLPGGATRESAASPEGRRAGCGLRARRPRPAVRAA